MRKNKLITLLLIILGNVLYALTVQLFLVPSGLITGGTTGIALALNKLLQIPVSSFILCFNIAMLLLGWKILGRSFALTTVLSTFVYPISLGIFEKTLTGIVLTENMMLNAIFAGLGIGLSLGIVIREGASTGGMDIPPLILNKKFNLPVSASMYVFDVLILMMQAMMHTPEDTLYGILTVLIYTITLDYLLLNGTARTEVRIISDHTDEISRTILHEMDRGVTLLHAAGGYSHREKEIIMTIISSRELPHVERIAHSVDPECFMIISRVSEVSGHGFTSGKKYIQ